MREVMRVNFFTKPNLDTIISKVPTIPINNDIAPNAMPCLASNVLIVDINDKARNVVIIIHDMACNIEYDIL